MNKTLLAVLMAASFTATAGDPLRLQGGTEGGGYWNKMRAVAHKANLNVARNKLNLQPILTSSGGSIQNAEDFIDGNVDITMLQADATLGRTFPSNTKWTAADMEAGYFLINKAYHEKEGLVDLAELEGEPLYIVMAEGSGGEVMLRGIASADGGYKDNVEKYSIFAEDTYAAAEMAATGFTMLDDKKVPVVAMLVVTTPGKLSSDNIVTDFGSKLIIGEIDDDGDFNDAVDANGEDLYHNCVIPRDKHQGIKGATLGAQETICVQSYVIYNPTFAASYGKNAKTVRRAVSKAINRTIK